MKLIRQYKGLPKENYILFLGRMVTSMGSMVIPILTLILNQVMDLEPSHTSWVIVTAGLVYIPAGLVGGKLSDHFSKKMVIIWCDLISVTLYIACGILVMFGIMNFINVALVAVAAACQSAEMPAYNALVADINKTEDRNRAYSLLYLGSNIGLVASPTIAGFLLHRCLWAIFIISGLSIGISTLLIFLKVKNIAPVHEEGKGTAYQERKNNVGILEVFRDNKVIFLFIICMTLYMAAYYQYGFLMPLDLARVHGETGAELYGTVSSLNCIVVVLFTPLFTHWAKKLMGPDRTFLGFFFVLSGYLLYLFMGLALHMPVFYYVGIIVFTFGEILTTTTVGPYISTRIPASHRGRVNGILTVCESVAEAVSILVCGMLYEIHDGKQPDGCIAAWGFVIGVIVLAIVLVGILRIFDKRKFKELYTKNKPE